MAECGGKGGNGPSLQPWNLYCHGDLTVYGKNQRRSVMNRKSLAMGLTVSCVLALGSGRATAGQLALKGSFSGTFVNTQTDTNGDGQKASLNSVGAKGTLGAATIQGVNEFVFSGPTTCPNGNAGSG